MSWTGSAFAFTVMAIVREHLNQGSPLAACLSTAVTSQPPGDKWHDVAGDPTLAGAVPPFCQPRGRVPAELTRGLRNPILEP